MLTTAHLRSLPTLWWRAASRELRRVDWSDERMAEPKEPYSAALMVFVMVEKMAARTVEWWEGQWADTMDWTTVAKSALQLVAQWVWRRAGKWGH